jgi:hypothetical protein
VNRDGRSSVVVTEVVVVTAACSANAGRSIVGVYCVGASFAALLGFVARLVVERVVLPRFVADRVLDVAFFGAIEFSPDWGRP